MNLPSEPPALRLRVFRTAVGVTVVVTGDLDLVTADAFETFVQAVLGEPRGGVIELDLSAVGCLDSFGMRSLVRLHHAAKVAGSVLMLGPLSPVCEAVIAVAGLERLLSYDPLRR